MTLLPELHVHVHVPRQFSWLGPNLTSHSTPDEQANHQLSMKEKAGVMKPPMTPNTKPSIYRCTCITIYNYIHVYNIHVHVLHATDLSMRKMRSPFWKERQVLSSSATTLYGLIARTCRGVDWGGGGRGEVGKGE